MEKHREDNGITCDNCSSNINNMNCLHCKDKSLFKYNDEYFNSNNNEYFNSNNKVEIILPYGKDMGWKEVELFFKWCKRNLGEDIHGVHITRRNK